MSRQDTTGFTKKSRDFCLLVLSYSPPVVDTRIASSWPKKHPHIRGNESDGSKAKTNQTEIPSRLFNGNGWSMKPTRVLKGLMVFLAAMGVCLPQSLFASQPTQAPNIVDVALGDGGVLLGQVVDVAGTAKAKVPVSLQSGQQTLGMSETDANGYYAFSGLRGGVYQVVAAEGQGAYRAWTPGTAPPTAQQGALVVAGQDLVRGQTGGRLKFWLSNPWVIAGIVATAVAVPVAIATSQHHHNEPVTPSGL